MKVSIVVPCFNEAENLSELTHKFSSLSRKIQLELILVNNGSTDHSGSILKDLAVQYSFVKVICLKDNKGYGNGIYQGLKQAKFSLIGWTHADLQTDPNDIARALEVIEGNDHDEKVYLKGYRSGRPFIDTTLSFLMGVSESLIFQRKLVEINAQPNIFHRSLLNNLTNPPLDFNFDLYSYVTALRLGYKVQRIHTKFPPRKHGASKWNKGIFSVISFILKTLKYSLKLRFQSQKNH